MFTQTHCLGEVHQMPHVSTQIICKVEANYSSYGAKREGAHQVDRVEVDGRWTLLAGGESFPEEVLTGGFAVTLRQ